MKTAILYLVLVGLPTLGVLGVLRAGQSLTPPVSVSGLWNVEISTQAAGNSPCGEQFDKSEILSLSIKQSGTHLLFSFEKKKINLAGEIDGPNGGAAAVRLSAATASEDAGQADAVRLRATAEREARPERLHGSLSFARCPAGTEVSFIATRQLNTTEVR